MGDKNRGPPQYGTCSNMVTEQSVKLGGKIWVSSTNGTCSYQCIFCDCQFSTAKSFELHIPNEHFEQRGPAQQPPPSPPPQMQVARVNARRESRFEREKNHTMQNNSGNQSAAGYRKSNDRHQNATGHRRMNVDTNKHRETNRHQSHGESNGATPSADAQQHHHHRRHVKKEAEQFNCPRCDARFRTFEVLRDHIRRRHFYVCKHCTDAEGHAPKAFETEKGLWAHQRSHHPKYYPRKCDVCVRAFETRQQLKEHMETAHVRGKDVKCDFCDRVLMSQFQKKNHIKRAHSERRYHCQLCKCLFICCRFVSKSRLLCNILNTMQLYTLLMLIEFFYRVFSFR